MGTDGAGRGIAPRGRSKGVTWKVIASYVLDWAILVAVGVIGLLLGNITPNKRPFSLDDPNISFPFTVKETVPSWLLLVCNAGIPIVSIIVIALILVPGSTVPRGTPKSLIWQRKLWELHTGLLGLALSLISAWIITNGMKNLFGKPRPDLLARCQPDLENLADYIVGGMASVERPGQLVSGNICKNPDKGLLDDGFRSYPSGHSSSSAAGLIYLSLFIASKFAITMPFLAPFSAVNAASSLTAFPSRIGLRETVEPRAAPVTSDDDVRGELLSGSNSSSSLKRRLAAHSSTVAAARRQAAAPPLYLLLICILPTFGAVFIASSRWFDFRHHGFDILFGFLIGLLAATFAFRYYHLPVSQGAGWAWGPRSHDKAFWAGIGSYSYATEHWRAQGALTGVPGDVEAAAVGGGGMVRPGDEEEGGIARGMGVGHVHPALVATGMSRPDSAGLAREKPL